MADYWTAPKTNWNTSDGVSYADLNRIEANVSANRDANFRRVQGFGYSIDNTVVGEDGVVTLFPGSCYSVNGMPIKMPANFVKNLTTWAQGNGAAFGGMASAVTVAAYTWYYAFVIMDPTDGSTEIMFDDNPSGTNIISGIFTEKRFINSFKTNGPGADGSFELVEMYSIGDKVFINPNSMFSGGALRFPNGVVPDGTYSTITLTAGVPLGLALPAKAVLANLNINTFDIYDFGFISRYLSIFTVPASLKPAAVWIAEFLHRGTDPSKYANADFHIMIDAASQISFAMIGNIATGYTDIAVRGFTDERLQ